jgi:hypothetical protein
MRTRVEKHYTFDVEIIKKTSTAVVKRLFSLTKFPSVEVDGKKIAELRDVTREELEAALGRCG